MMKMMKTCKAFFILMLIGFFVLVYTSMPSIPAQAAGENIRVVINNKNLKMDIPPCIINGWTMVPVRAIFEGLGATVSWDENTGLITATRDNSTIVMQNGQSIAVVNDQSIKLDVPVRIIENRTMVPLRFIAKGFHDTVKWDRHSRTVYITSQYLYENSNIDIKKPDLDSTDRILEKDTEITYATSKTEWFKAGTAISFYDNKYVKRGTLLNDSFLKCSSDTAVPFKTGTEVTFNKYGMVESGVLKNDANLPFSMDKNKLGKKAALNSDGSSTTFAAGNLTTFHNNCVKSGVLKYDTELMSADGGMNLYAANTPVSFFEDGYIQKGTILLDKYYKYKEGYTVFLKGGSPISYDINGFIRQGRLVEDSELECRKDYYIKFASDTEIAFHDTGYVSKGTLKNNTVVYYLPNSALEFQYGTVVEFFDDGFLRSGILYGDQHIKTLVFKDRTPISFYPGGTIHRGTLRYEAILKGSNGEMKSVEAGSTVILEKNGLLSDCE